MYQLVSKEIFGKVFNLFDELINIFSLYVCVVIFGNLFGSASYYVDLFMLFLFLFFFRSFVAFNINIGDTVRQHTSN